MRWVVLIGLGAAVAGCVPVQQYDAYGQAIPYSPGAVYGQPAYAAPGYAAPGYAPGYTSPGYVSPDYAPAYVAPGYVGGGYVGGGYGYARPYPGRPYGYEQRDGRPEYGRRDEPRRDYGGQPDQRQGQRRDQVREAPAPERRPPPVIRPQPGQQGVPLPFPGMPR